MTQDNSADVADGTAIADDQDDTDSIEETSNPTAQMSRRKLLKGTASAAVGMTGLSAISGTAAAGGWGTCHHVPPSAPSWFGYLDPVNGAHNIPAHANNGLTVYIHGFQTGRQRAVDDGHEVWRHLRDLGYPGACFSFSWAAGNGINDWWAAKGNAVNAGKWLADYLNGRGWTTQDAKNIDIVCHSLGAKVALECLRVLRRNHGKSVHTVHLLGGAAHDRDVGGTYRPDVEGGCGWMHNWHSASDPVLSQVYRSVEGGKWPVGFKGIASGPVPNNYTDHATGMKQHCQYMDYKYGVVRDVYNLF